MSSVDEKTPTTLVETPGTPRGRMTTVAEAKTKMLARKMRKLSDDTSEANNEEGVNGEPAKPVEEMNEEMEVNEGELDLLKVMEKRIMDLEMNLLAAAKWNKEAIEANKALAELALQEREVKPKMNVGVEELALVLKNMGSKNNGSYKPAKLIKFKPGGSVLPSDHLVAVSLFSTRTGAGTNGRIAVLFDSLEVDEQQWLLRLITDYVWDIESCTEAQWKVVEAKFVDHFAGTMTERERQWTNVAQGKHERMENYLPRVAGLGRQANVTGDRALISRAFNGILPSIRGNFGYMTEDRSWTNFSSSAITLYSSLVPRTGARTVNQMPTVINSIDNDEVEINAIGRGGSFVCHLCG